MTTLSFTKVREAMVDSQIHPMGVVDEAILDAFLTIPREAFLPPEKQGIAYCDEDIRVAPGRYMMEPSVLARMIEAVRQDALQNVLITGAGEGYAAAILSRLFDTVIAMEEEEHFMIAAQDVWNKIGCHNIAGFVSPDYQTAKDHAPYDIILFNGAVCEIPPFFLHLLKAGGKAVAPIKESGQSVASVTEVTQTQNGIWSDRILFQSGTPHLRGFEPKKEFVFWEKSLFFWAAHSNKMAAEDWFGSYFKGA